MHVSGLTPPEARVLGCLLEKQRTTPDAYPLSLNALRLACNQSTNRDPVVDYDEAMIREALHRLERRGMTRLASGAGSRAAKYRHLLAQALPMDDAEQALVCVLLLRGPQTPGELKQRCERMHVFADLAAVHEALARLIDRDIAQRLARRPGQKEERYRQLLEQADGEPQGASAAADVGDAARPGPAAPAEHEPPNGELGAAPAAAMHASPELAELRDRVARLERELARLREAIGAPVGVQQP